MHVKRLVVGIFLFSTLTRQDFTSAAEIDIVP